MSTAPVQAGRSASAESRWRTLLDGPLAPLAHLGLVRAALRRDAPAEALPHLEAAAAGRELLFVASVTGTEGDPQSLSRTTETLKAAGVTVCDSNAAAARLVAFILARG